MLGFAGLTQLPRQRKAVHLWHVDIEQRNVGNPCRAQLERGMPAQDASCVIPFDQEDRRDRFGARLIVVDDQQTHVRRGSGRDGPSRPAGGEMTMHHKSPVIFLLPQQRVFLGQSLDSGQ